MMPVIASVSLAICRLSAQSYTTVDALAQYQTLGLTLPEKEADGRIPTLNKKGAVSPALDPATKAFIEFGKNKKVLEIGGGYGIVMGNMLEQYPETVYHINDLDSRHLFIAAQIVSSIGLSSQTLQNIRFISGDACELDLQEKYDALLIARVLHFMDPQTLDCMVQRLSDLVKPGGRVFVVALSPYVKRYEKFIPEYEARLQKGELYPGYIQSLRDWVTLDIISPAQQAAISDGSFMFLDDTVLKRVFKAHGFNVISASFEKLSYHSPSWTLDGRENVIFIGEKTPGGS